MPPDGELPAGADFPVEAGLAAAADLPLAARGGELGRAAGLAAEDARAVDRADELARAAGFAGAGRVDGARAAGFVAAVEARGAEVLREEDAADGAAGRTVPDRFADVVLGAGADLSASGLMAPPETVARG